MVNKYIMIGFLVVAGNSLAMSDEEYDRWYNENTPCSRMKRSFRETKANVAQSFCNGKDAVYDFFAYYCTPSQSQQAPPQPSFHMDEVNEAINRIKSTMAEFVENETNLFARYQETQNKRAGELQAQIQQIQDSLKTLKDDQSQAAKIEELRNQLTTMQSEAHTKQAELEKKIQELGDGELAKTLQNNNLDGFTLV